MIDVDRALELESDLNAISEFEMRTRIENLKLFEGLNSERPTPLFLSLAKNRNCGALTLIPAA